MPEPTTAHGIDPIVEALFNCCAAHLSGQAAALVRGILDGLESPDLFWHTAQEHCLLNHVHQIVCDVAPDHFERSDLNWVQGARVSATAKSLGYLRELTRIILALREAGIDSLPLKGPTLALSAYGSPIARSFMDLDIGVKSTDLDRAIDVVAALDYRPSYKRSKSAEVQYRRSTHDYSMLRSDSIVTVELHPRLGSHGLPRVTIATLCDRSIEMNLGDLRVSCLSREDMVWYLAAHGSRHRWPRAEWVVALAYQIVRGGELDWDEAVRLSKATRTHCALLLGLALVQRHLGVELPDDLRASIRASEKVQHLLRMSEASLSKAPLSALEIVHFRVLLLDRSIDKVRLLDRTLLKQIRKLRPRPSSKRIGTPFGRSTLLGAQLGARLVRGAVKRR